jgi:hypothetical protein
MQRLLAISVCLFIVATLPIIDAQIEPYLGQCLLIAGGLGHAFGLLVQRHGQLRLLHQAQQLALPVQQPGVSSGGRSEVNGRCFFKYSSHLCQ